MSKTKKKPAKRPVVSVPQGLEEATDFIRRVGEAQRAISKIQIRLNNQVKKLTTEVAPEIKQYEESIDQLVEGLFVFAEARRDQLTDSGKRKTVSLPTGEFGWRLTPPSVSLRSIKEVVTALKGLGLTQFIRIKEEPDKEAMLKEPALAKTVKGVTINQHEEFVVKPVELKLEIVSRADKLKRAAA